MQSLKKKEIKINNKEKITKICIDDFAIKKGHTYGTIMIDIESHKVIDIIFSRENNDVSEWLKSYPNIKVVSRDGSITYKNAISIAHPSAIQISDRFHILKNLTEYCKQYLTKYFKAKVIINNNLDNKPKSKNIINYSQNEKVLKAMQMFNVGIKKAKICEALKLNIKTLNKILEFDELDINYYGKSKLRIIQEERLKNKQEIINEAREMRKNCIPISKIAKALNLDRRTISKYLDEKTTGISTRLGVKRKSKLDQYINYIDKLIEIGVTSKTIYSKIKEMGYTGSESLIRNYKAQNKNNNYTSIVTTEVKRSSLIKLLYKPISKIKELSNEIVNKIYNSYPIYKEIINLVIEFKNILSSRTIDEFDRWIHKATELNINEINSFVNGITRDIDAVKNAVLYEYNNGLAEGVINKLKLIKRIMYGRCNFNLLKNKILRLENLKFN
ncbi:transposase [Clostridium acetireducens DSM 10703]|uniref:Transposase n=1 Tax=Clostridium acetireducens DSM 10703 TaxID=1121290 RepID=A0A1E8EY04_9CLOT|nr:ISL3 family transposase [Clostridium acetireducens]OFI05810.1 transposase [Clostridium acetireducens DSM 10703]